MVTLKDIALAANMSVTQVSRALNDRDDVSEATKKRVQKLANDMGYIKNITAKNLAMSLTSEIALVLEGFSDTSNLVNYNSIYPILCGVNKIATENEQSVAVHILPEKIKSYVTYFRTKGINNAILYGFEYDDNRLKELNESNITCVYIDVYVDKPNIGCVVVNNTLYSIRAVEALIESGKNNIAMISGTPHALVCLEREAGYKIALEKSEKKPYDIVFGNFEQSDAKQQTFKLLKKFPEIDAIFCASDYMAFGCMEAAEKMGKKIPEDIAVMGFDDIPIAKYTKPSLSTVSQDDYLKGVEAAKLLIKMITKEDVQAVKTLDCKVVLRDSV